MTPMSGTERQSCLTGGGKVTIPEERRALALRGGLARPLLCRVLVRAGVFTVGAILGTGCFLPQEDDPLVPILTPNSPPRILEDQASPPKREQPVRLPNPEDCKQVFSAPVEDPDIDDRVTYRWYVDYGPESNPTPEDESYAGNTGTPLRTLATFTVHAMNHPRVQVAGYHEVLLMVFDGRLLLEDGPGSKPPDDPVPTIDGGLNPHFSTTHVWTVITDPSGTCQEVAAP